MSKYTLLETNKEIAYLGNPYWYLANAAHTCNLTYPLKSMLLSTPYAVRTYDPSKGITSIYDMHIDFDEFLWSQGYLFTVKD